MYEGATFAGRNRPVCTYLVLNPDASAHFLETIDDPLDCFVLATMYSTIQTITKHTVRTSFSRNSLEVVQLMSEALGPPRRPFHHHARPVLICCDGRYLFIKGILEFIQRPESSALQTLLDARIQPKIIRRQIRQVGG